MRRLLAVGVLLAALAVFPGCQALPGFFAGADSAESQAHADIRGAIPAIEAFYADNGTYAGITVGGLRATYDPAVPDIRIVVASAESYCVESDVEGGIWSKARLDAEIRPGPCPDPGPDAPPSRPAAVDQLRTVVVAMEARFARTGSFDGVTAAWLERMIPGLRPVRVVEAGPQSYCIEITGEGHTYAARGPSGDVGVGGC